MYISTLYVFLGAKISRKKQSGLNTLPCGTVYTTPNRHSAGMKKHRNADFY
jgi:hypothetical protein